MYRRILLFAILLTACSSNNGGSSPDGGSSSAFSTNVPSSAKLSELSSAQRQDLCDEINSFASSPSWEGVIEGSCRLAAIIGAAFSNPQDDAALQAACTTFYDQCKSDVSDPGTAASLDCTSQSSTWTCTATVGELVACANDMVTAVANALSSIPSCSQVTLADLNGDAGLSLELVLPPSCQALQAKCPASAKASARAR